MSIRAFVCVIALLIPFASNGQSSNAPQTETGSYLSIPLPISVGPDGQLKSERNGTPFAVTANTVWLTVSGKSTCYYLYDEHYYEAKTSAGRGGAGQPVNVNSIAMSFRLDGDTGTQICTNTSICAKTIK